MLVKITLTASEVLDAVARYLETYHGMTITKNGKNPFEHAVEVMAEKYFKPSEQDAWGR